MTAKEDKGFFVNPFKKSNIGWRTGKDIKAGKNIRKDNDGYERFEDYFSESDADLTSNHSMWKSLNFTKTKENIENEAENEKELEQNEEITRKSPQKISSQKGLPLKKNSGNAVNNRTMKQKLNTEDVNPVAWLKNKDVGRRTGRSIKAGKNIRKDKDGYEVFEDYWSESDADSSVFSKSSYSSIQSAAEMAKSTLATSVQNSKLRVFKEGENPVAWVKNKNIGRRTGKNIKAGKNIRRDSCGYERFEDYWSESEIESLMESRMSESTLEKSRRLTRKSESAVEVTPHTIETIGDIKDSIQKEESILQNNTHDMGDKDLDVHVTTLTHDAESQITESSQSAVDSQEGSEDKEWTEKETERTKNTKRTPQIDKSCLVDQQSDGTDERKTRSSSRLKKSASKPSTEKRTKNSRSKKKHSNISFVEIETKSPNVDYTAGVDSQNSSQEKENSVICSASSNRQKSNKKRNSKRNHQEEDLVDSDMLPKGKEVESSKNNLIETDELENKIKQTEEKTKLTRKSSEKKDQLDIGNYNVNVVNEQCTLNDISTKIEKANDKSINRSKVSNKSSITSPSKDDKNDQDNTGRSNVISRLSTLSPSKIDVSDRIETNTLTRVSETIPAEDSESTSRLSKRSSKISETIPADDSKSMSRLSKRSSKISETLPAEDSESTSRLSKRSSKISETLPAEDSESMSRLSKRSSKISETLPAEDSESTSRLSKRSSKISETLPAEDSENTSRLSKRSSKISEKIPAEDSESTSRLSKRSSKISETLPAEDSESMSRLSKRSSKISETLPAEDSENTSRLSKRSSKISEKIPAEDSESTSRLSKRSSKISETLPAEDSESMSRLSKRSSKISEKIPAEDSENESTVLSKKSSRVSETLPTKDSENTSVLSKRSSMTKNTSLGESEELKNSRNSQKFSPLKAKSGTKSKSQSSEFSSQKNFVKKSQNEQDENTDQSGDENVKSGEEKPAIVNSPKLTKLTSNKNIIIHKETPHLTQSVAPSMNPIDIGGNVTGSITRCEERTQSVTGITPAVSFKTRKRLSYSVAEVDETLHHILPRRLSDPTSDCSIREEKGPHRKSTFGKRKSLLTKSLASTVFNDGDTDSEASVGFLSLAAPPNKGDYFEEEDIVIVENNPLNTDKKTGNITKGRKSFANRTTTESYKTNRKSGVSKTNLEGAGKLTGRKRSHNSEIVDDAGDVNVENVDNVVSKNLNSFKSDNVKKNRKSKLSQEFEKEFDILSEDDSVSDIKRDKKGNKAISKKAGKKKGIKIKKGKTQEGKKGKGKESTETTAENDAGSENNSEKDAYDLENHVDLQEKDTDIIAHQKNKTLKETSKSDFKRQREKKKFFVFDESEMESIASLTEDNNLEPCESGTENYKGKTSVKKGRKSSKDDDDIENSNEVKNKNKSVKRRNKTSVRLSLPRTRKRHQLLTPQSLPRQKRKRFARSEIQKSNRMSNKGTQDTDDIPEDEKVESDLRETAHEKTTQKMSISLLESDLRETVHEKTTQKMSISLRENEKQNDKKSEVKKCKQARTSSSKDDLDYEASTDNDNKQKSVKRRNSKVSDKSSVSADDSLDVSPRKKKKGSKISVSLTPVSVRQSFSKSESPFPFEEEVFQSGVSFRQRSHISEILSPSSRLTISLPADEVDGMDNPSAEEPPPQGRKSAPVPSITVMSSASPNLTPCLVKPGVGRKSKGRRVTINNFPTQQTFTAEVSGNSSIDETPKSTGNISNLNSTASTPVHFFEVTNTETPTPVVMQPKQKLIFPSPAPDGLRRSRRTRVKTLDWFKNEKLIYERRKSGVVIAGIQPSVVECKILQNEAKRKAKLQKRKTKRKGKITQSSPARNLSMHVDLPSELDVTISNEIPVVNPDTNQEVLLECVGTKEMCVYVGPTGEEPKVSDPFLMSRILDHNGIGNGFLLIRPEREKPEQLLTKGSLMFVQLRGKISVTINRTTTILEAEDTFLVPRGNIYCIKNLRSDIDAKLFYTVIKDPETETSEEEQE